MHCLAWSRRSRHGYQPSSGRRFEQSVGGDGSCLGQGRLSLSFRRVSYDVEELIEIIRAAAELTLRLW